DLARRPVRPLTDDPCTPLAARSHRHRLPSPTTWSARRARGTGARMTDGPAVVDLDTCADEPIRVPGSVQPHGVLLAVSEPDLVVRHVSANVADLTGVAVRDAVDAPLAEVAGLAATDVLRAHLRTFGDLRA